MFTKYIALVSQSQNVSFGTVSKIAAAIQKQVTRDFTPIWEIPATVGSFELLDDVPSDYWPIVIMDDIGYPGAAGIHLDKNGQPYALVQSSGVVSLTCSHECLEMLADPFGNRFVAGDSIVKGQGRVNYLVEVCDPSEGEQFAYSCNGLLVSDFYTPHYFDPISNPSTRYSYGGFIREARQILAGGYLSWMVPETGSWWQATFFDGAAIQINELGALGRDNGKSWREIIDAHTFQPVEKQMALGVRDIHTMQVVSGMPAVQAASSGRSAQLKGNYYSGCCSQSPNR